MKTTPRLICPALILTAGIIISAIIFYAPSRTAPTAEAGFIEDVSGFGFDLAACSIASEFDEDLAKLAQRGIDELKGLICGRAESIPVVGGFIESACGGDSGSGQESSFVPVHVRLDDPAATLLEQNEAANCMKKNLLKFVSENIVRSIVQDSGFVENFRDLLADAAARGEQDFLGQLSISGICPQNRGVIFALMGGVDAGWTQSSNEPGSIVRCTLAQVLDYDSGEYEAYLDDFRVGGWDAWFAQINPDNTLTGQYLDAVGARNASIAAEVRGQEVEAIASEGFNPKKERVCVQNITLPLPTGEGEQEVCIRYEDRILTPGSTLSNQVQRALGIQLDDLRGADTYYELLYEAVTRLGDWIIGTVFDDDGLSSYSASGTNSAPGGSGPGGQGETPPGGGGSGAGDTTGGGGGGTAAPGRLLQSTLITPSSQNPAVGETVTFRVQTSVVEARREGETFLLIMDWGDNSQSRARSVVSQGVLVFTVSHAWRGAGTFTIKANITSDVDEAGSNFTEQVTVRSAGQTGSGGASTLPAGWSVSSTFGVINNMYVIASDRQSSLIIAAPASAGSVRAVSKRAPTALPDGSSLGPTEVFAVSGRTITMTSSHSTTHISSRGSAVTPFDVEVQEQRGGVWQAAGTVRVHVRSIVHPGGSSFSFSPSGAPLCPGETLTVTIQAVKSGDFGGGAAAGLVAWLEKGESFFGRPASGWRTGPSGTATFERVVEASDAGGAAIRARVDGLLLETLGGIQFRSDCS